MKVSAKNENIVELLRTLKDHRRGQGLRHPLDVVLMIIIMGIMSGAKGERAIVRFAANNKTALIKALHIERQEIPTRSVIKGVIEHIDFSALQNLFYHWALNIIPIKKKDIISIDGKAIAGTLTGHRNNLQNSTSLVSVFVSKRRQVLTASRIENKKESEIPAVRDLIEMLDLSGVTFALDALHCQEKTVQMIKKSGNHYLIGVKDNQRGLYREIKKRPASHRSVPKKRT